MRGAILKWDHYHTTMPTSVTLYPLSVSQVEPSEVTEHATDAGHAEDATATDVINPSTSDIPSTGRAQPSISLRPQRDSAKRAREKQQRWAQDILDDSSWPLDGQPGEDVGT